jgi:alpha-L-fucosidase-like protein
LGGYLLHPALEGVLAKARRRPLPGRYRGPGAQFASDDIRFTTKGDSLCAIMLAWPQKRKLIIKSLASNSPYYRSEVARIELLGSHSKVVWSRNKEGLAVKLPQKVPCDYAYVFRINLLPKWPQVEMRSAREGIGSWFSDRMGRYHEL